MLGYIRLFLVMLGVTNLDSNLRVYFRLFCMTWVGGFVSGVFYNSNDKYYKNKIDQMLVIVDDGYSLLN